LNSAESQPNPTDLFSSSSEAGGGLALEGEITRLGSIRPQQHREHDEGLMEEEKSQDLFRPRESNLLRG
jgi:hypothetical protein